MIAVAICRTAAEATTTQWRHLANQFESCRISVTRPAQGQGKLQKIVQSLQFAMCAVVMTNEKKVEPL